MNPGGHAASHVGMHDSDADLDDDSDDDSNCGREAPPPGRPAGTDPPAARRHHPGPQVSRPAAGSGPGYPARSTAQAPAAL